MIPTPQLYESTCVLSAVEICKYELRTINELKAAIRKEIASVKPEMIHRVMQNFIIRLEMSTAKEGYQLSKMYSKPITNKQYFI